MLKTVDRSDPLGGPITSVSLVDDIAERFRRSVISGALRPGDEINESQLAETLGVSRGTVREAISVVVGEGLFVKSVNHPARVQALTAEKAWEIMTARAVIEGYAARLLAERLTDDKMERLRAIWGRLNEAATAGDTASFMDWDFRLHQTIMELSGHGVLLDTWLKMSAWVRLMFSSEIYTVEEMQANARNHGLILEAIASGNPDRAEKQLKVDLLEQSNLEHYIGVVGTLSSRPPGARENALRNEGLPVASYWSQTGSE